jgi:hypothetical protein
MVPSRPYTMKGPKMAKRLRATLDDLMTGPASG